MNPCTKNNSLPLRYFFRLIRKVCDDQALNVIACDTFDVEVIHSHDVIDFGLMVDVIQIYGEVRIRVGISVGKVDLVIIVVEGELKRQGI